MENDEDPSPIQFSVRGLLIWVATVAVAMGLLALSVWLRDPNRPLLLYHVCVMAAVATIGAAIGMTFKETRRCAVIAGAIYIVLLGFGWWASNQLPPQG